MPRGAIGQGMPAHSYIYYHHKNCNSIVLIFNSNAIIHQSTSLRFHIRCQCLLRAGILPIISPSLGILEHQTYAVCMVIQEGKVERINEQTNRKAYENKRRVNKTIIPRGYGEVVYCPNCRTHLAAVDELEMGKGCVGRGQNCLLDLQIRVGLAISRGLYLS